MKTTAPSPSQARQNSPRPRAQKTRPARVALAVMFSLAGALHAQSTGFNQTAGGTWEYDNTANWVGGDINGIWDPLLVLGGAQTLTFASDATLANGLKLGYDGAFNLSFRGTGGDRTLTLGDDIVVNTVNTSRTITIGNATAGQNLNINLGGVNRNFAVGAGRTLLFQNVISNGGVTTSGGTVTYSAANTYTGATNIITGTLNLSGALGSAASSDFFLTANSGNVSTLAFLSNGNGNPGAIRVKSLTAKGGGNSSGVLLTVTGNSTANSVDSIANTFSTAGGIVTVTVNPNALRNARLEAGSFVRGAGSTVLFRGTDLGVSTVDSQTAGDANIKFGTVALSGAAGAAGSSTVSIIRGAYGDITTGGNGTGLVTHDGTNGVRLLNTATEYTAAITDAQTQLDNVRYVRTTGDATQDITLATELTTINSLSFRITGTNPGAGVTIGGGAGSTLKLASGMIFASQSMTSPTAADAMTVSVPTLDLNGGEGVFIAFTAGINNGNTAAPLIINSGIANDGGNGVTIGGTGEVVLSGAATHTYTGVTTLNSGILKLSKSVANGSIAGDFVMNGGTLLKNSNVIPDTASVTINAGSFVFDNTTSSGNNNHAETITNLTVNGGNLSNHGSNATLTILGNLTLNASTLGMNSGGDITVQGITTLNGGGLTAKESSSTSTFTGLTSLSNVVINAPAAGTYTAMTLTAHATNKGALLTLNGDVVFNGSATNTNPVLIDTSSAALANQGMFVLNGTRSFTISNGAAPTDLAINPALTDNGAFQGGIEKAGPGTLALNGSSTYTGETTVLNGTLLVAGVLSGSTTLNVNGGVLEIGAADRLSDAAKLTMTGGTFKTGGFQETLDVLDLGGSAALDLGTGASLLNFAASNGEIWTGSLSIFNWSGSLNGGGTDQIFFGHDLSGLASEQLALISFINPAGLPSGNYGATLLGTGELVAVPEPASVTCLLAGLGCLLGARRRRRQN